VAAVVLLLGVLVAGASVLTCRTVMAQGDRPPAAEGKVKTPPKQEREKEELTAWGKEVGGLQAGLGFAGAKRAYRPGEKVRLVVRVRNVGKEPVSFHYLRQFLQGTLAVTDGAGRPVTFDSAVTTFGRPQPQLVNLAPGQEIDLHELMVALRPAGESDGQGFATLFGTGTFRIQYGRLAPDDIDPILSRLATGQLGIEIKSDPKN
jgi:hypothetical protein